MFDMHTSKSQIVKPLIYFYFIKIQIQQKNN